jgi:hypothetical protein
MSISALDSYDASAEVTAQPTGEPTPGFGTADNSQDGEHAAEAHYGEHAEGTEEQWAEYYAAQGYTYPAGGDHQVNEHDTVEAGEAAEGADAALNEEWTAYYAQNADGHTSGYEVPQQDGLTDTQHEANADELYHYHEDYHHKNHTGDMAEELAANYLHAAGHGDVLVETVHEYSE